ncbi:MAG: DsbA family protein, partial [Chloroflexi bacterium]
GLDTDAFSACMADQRYADLLQQQDETRRATGIRTRPTFDINGQLVVGAQGYDAFKSVIEPLLAQ